MKCTHMRKYGRNRRFNVTSTETALTATIFTVIYVFIFFIYFPSQDFAKNFKRESGLALVIHVDLMTSYHEMKVFQNN